MGYNARGLAMSNAMVANITGDINGIYNPALATYQIDGLVNLDYTFLSQDRNLNFVGFTRKVMLPSQKTGGAGITVAWLNAGVSDIDARDNDTRSIGTLSTFENEFYLGTAFIIDPKISLGLGFKLYYSKLYTDVTTTSFAIDIGGIYKASNLLSFGLLVKDLGAKYEWQTTVLYGSNGNTTENKFPKVLEIGATYLLPKTLGLVSLDLQQYFNPSSEADQYGVVPEKTNNTVLNFGTEINIIQQLKFRAGLGRMDFSADDFSGNLEPSFGLGVNKSFSKSINMGIDYSFQLEPYTHKPIQNIGVIFKFK